jgi:hypothetical protein
MMSSEPDDSIDEDSFWRAPRGASEARQVITAAGRIHPAPFGTQFAILGTMVPGNTRQARP